MALDPERITSFNKDMLAEILREKIVPEVSSQRMREIREKIIRIPDLLNSFDKYHMSREQSVIKGLKHGQAWKAFMEKERLTREERRIVLGYFTELTGHILHYEFFLPSFELQASQEQLAKWVPLCESLDIIGCYAQTELAHGSNVRGIEIEARYDEQNKEFVFHSPTITATKWWIGGLGLVSTHALIVARLILKGQDFGPHAFLIQLRNTKTHEPLPGIDVGDIGPKMAMHANDNGYLRFDNYRQPKDAMLNRFARISDAGDYEIIDTNAIKILYLSLIRARSALIFDAWYPLACALTISIRYSLVREQFPDPENPNKEKKILDYQIQRFKLFKVLARLYASIFARPFIKAMYTQAEQKLKAGDDSELAFLHCIMSLYKSYVTYTTLEGIEEARRSCGGHGFLMLSGLPSLYGEYLPSITFDGDNSILTLQSARYFMSLLRKPKQMPAPLAYLTEKPEKLVGEPHCSRYHQTLFEAAARQKMHRLVAREHALLAQGKQKEKIWNEELQVQAIEACEAAYYASIHGYFAAGISEINDPAIREAVETLRQVYATCELERFSGELVRAGLTSECLDRLKQVQIEGLDKIRPNALGMVEVFEIGDEALNSVIGRKDGMVYQHMLRTSKYLNPLNKDIVFPGIKQYLRPKI